MTLHLTQIFFTDARTFIAFAALLCAQNTGAKSLSSFLLSVFSSQFDRAADALLSATTY
jgi:hypothetical protein